MGNLFFFSLQKNTFLIKERKLSSSKLSPMICKQRIFNCRWDMLHQKQLNDTSGKRVEVLAPVVFILTLRTSRHTSWQPSHRRSHPRHEEDLHPCLLPLRGDGSSGRPGDGGRARAPAAKEGAWGQPQGRGWDALEAGCLHRRVGNGRGFKACFSQTVSGAVLYREMGLFVFGHVQESVFWQCSENRQVVHT